MSRAFQSEAYCLNKPDMTNQDYLREVMINLVAVTDEASTIIEDTHGPSLEANIRRAAIDGVIAASVDKNMHMLAKAAKVCGLSPSKTAQLIAAFNTIEESERDNWL